MRSTPAVALALLGGLLLAACDGAAPVDPDPDPDPEPEPDPITLDGTYASEFFSDDRTFEWSFELVDEEGALSLGDLCRLVVTVPMQGGNSIHVNGCSIAHGEHDEETVTLHADVGVGGGLGTLAFVGTISAEGDRLTGTVSGSYSGEAVSGGAVFDRGDS